MPAGAAGTGRTTAATVRRVSRPVGGGDGTEEAA